MPKSRLFELKRGRRSILCADNALMERYDFVNPFCVVFFFRFQFIASFFSSPFISKQFIRVHMDPYEGNTFYAQFKTGYTTLIYPNIIIQRFKVYEN